MLLQLPRTKGAPDYAANNSAMREAVTAGLMEGKVSVRGEMLLFNYFEGVFYNDHFADIA